MTISRCLLVVDQDTGRLSVMTRALRRAGYQVEEAQNGLAALQRPEDSAPLDAILLSTQLPGVDGYETVMQLRSSLHFWSLPILLLVPESEIGQTESQELFGADGFIQVPCPTAKLIEKIEALLTEKQIRESLQTRMRKRIQDQLGDIVDQTITEATQGRMQELVEQLRVSVVDLVEDEARQEMKTRMEQLANEQSQQVISEIIREMASPLINEVAEDAVTRQVNSVIEEKTDSLMARLESRELPEAAQRAISEEARQQMPRFQEELIRVSVEQAVQSIKDIFPKLIENEVGKTLPKVAEQKLPPLVERLVEKQLSTVLPMRISSELNTEMEARIRPMIRRQRWLLYIYALVVILVSGVAGTLLGRFLPKLF